MSKEIKEELNSYKVQKGSRTKMGFLYHNKKSDRIGKTLILWTFLKPRKRGRQKKWLCKIQQNMRLL